MSAETLHRSAAMPEASRLAQPLLAVRDLGVRFEMATGLLRPSMRLQALQDVSFELATGEVLGIVGESGCGKSTLARAVLQLTRPTAGELAWRGRVMGGLDAAGLKAVRGEMQPVFQDPRASLDPRMTISRVVEEPLTVFRPDLDSMQREALVTAMLERVGLPAAARLRYAHEFSGGQCQRIAIARALILEPALLVCDEPVSSLDVSVQAQIVNLLRRLQRELGLAMLFVSHNLAVVRYVSTRVLVLYLGRTMELASREELFAGPLHPYTRALLAAIPDPDRRGSRNMRVSMSGSGTPQARDVATELPSALAPPSGCVFRTRCPLAIAICVEQRPLLERVSEGRWVACHRWREVVALPAPQSS